MFLTLKLTLLGQAVSPVDHLRAPGGFTLSTKLQLSELPQPEIPWSFMLPPVTLIEGLPLPGVPGVVGAEPKVRSFGKAIEKPIDEPGRTHPFRLPPPDMYVPRAPPPLLGAQMSAGQAATPPGQTSA